jgi:hypothetical protein
VFKVVDGSYDVTLQEGRAALVIYRYRYLFYYQGTNDSADK